MLKPYVCVACEKVIVAQDGVASLIGLFSKMIVAVPTGVEIPNNAVTPKEWAVFSIWVTEPGDEHKQYEVCTQFIYKDGSQFGEIARHKINIELNKRAQVVVQIPGFPIGQPDFLTIRTWIEENQQKVFGPIEFRIELEVKRIEQEKTIETIAKT